MMWPQQTEKRATSVHSRSCPTAHRRLLTPPRPVFIPLLWRRQNELAERFPAERRQTARSIDWSDCRWYARPRPLARAGRQKCPDIAEPKRIRDRSHLNLVALQTCLIRGRQARDPHHLRFAQPRAIGMKIGDEFTVPICRGHHPELHETGNVVAWLEKQKIKPLDIARKLCEQSHPKRFSSSTDTMKL